VSIRFDLVAVFDVLCSLWAMLFSKGCERLEYRDRNGVVIELRGAAAQLERLREPLGAFQGKFILLVRESASIFIIADFGLRCARQNHMK
jgi:hypothetical protein